MTRKVQKDFALLDRGAEEENRFVVIEDITVDDNGNFAGGIDIGKVMSNEAVKNGAVRINHSDCVDMSNGGQRSYNDNISYFNGGDLYDPDTVIPEKIQFLVDEGLLV